MSDLLANKALSETQIPGLRLRTVVKTMAGISTVIAPGCVLSSFVLAIAKSVPVYGRLELALLTFFA